MDHPTGGQVGVGWKMQPRHGAWPVGSLTQYRRGKRRGKVLQVVHTSPKGLSGGFGQRTHKARTGPRPAGNGSDDHRLWPRSRLSIARGRPRERGMRLIGPLDGLLTGNGAESAGRNLLAGGRIATWPSVEKRPNLRHHMPIRPWKYETAMVSPAWESINAQHWIEVFVAYFTEFCDPSRSNEDVAAHTEEEMGYTDKSCRSRTSYARSITGAGRATDALAMVRCSTSPLVPSHIKKKASELVRQREAGML